MLKYKSIFVILLFLINTQVQAKQIHKLHGTASWYTYQKGNKSHKTASGELFSPYKHTAAHRTLPFGTKVKVTNLKNNKSVTVVINDRGPFRKGRIIDLSKSAAKTIGMTGTDKVSVKILS